MPEDLLSQNEIDALFSELTRSPDEAAEVTQERFRSVRPYDFRHPSKLSKDQLRTLQMIFEGFARQASSSLSGLLRSQVHVALVSIEQSVYDDYVRALPQRTLLNLATADPLPGTFVFEYDIGTALVIVDRLLGGVGKAAGQDRAITDIEEALLQSIATVLLEAMTEAWAHLVPLEAKLQRLEYSPRFLQIAPQNEPVLLLLFDLRVHERQTTVSMCIPYSVIEPISSDLTVQTLFNAVQREVTPEESAEVRMRLQRVTVPLAAVLGTTELPVATVNDLQAGDVIRLDGLATDPLVLTVNKKSTYVARPGLVRHGIAVQIVGVLHDGEEA